MGSTHPEFAQPELKSSSKVRVSRIVTLERRLVKRKLGSLGLQFIESLDRILVNLLRLNSRSNPLKSIVGSAHPTG
jgi:mRNA interferase MazF